MSFRHLSDEALLADLGAICSDERHLIARQVRYLAEVEDRRLELRGAYSSMFDFCTRGLGMSDGIAFRRLNAARLARTFPALIGAIERGDVHLCGLVELKEVLTEETFDEILAEAKGKSTRKLQQLAARRKAAARAQASLPLLPAPTSAAAASADLVPEPLPAPHRRMHFDASAALETKLDRVRDFVAESGARCPSRTLLELDHVESRALGGGDESANLRVRCRAHNRLHAEQVFGSEHVKRRIDERQRASRRRQEHAVAGDPRDGVRRDAAEETTADLCIRGLTNMGFAEAKARRVVALVAERRGPGGHPSFRGAPPRGSRGADLAA